MAKNLIIIPARYGSTRLPAKPLAMIAGKTMLSRMVKIAIDAANMAGNCEVLVATDHEAIANHCKELGAEYVMTDENCISGTDRCARAVKLLKSDAEFIVNLQGDTPLTPPDFIAQMIESYANNPADIITLVTKLSWAELDLIREQKLQTPFSGTCAIVQPKTMRALWFSKQVIPAIRAEEKMRVASGVSPIWRHIGIYGYSRDTLDQYADLGESYYEKLEGLEQLRMLENGYAIGCVSVDYGTRPAMSGVDSAEDILRAEALIAKHGEL